MAMSTLQVLFSQYVCADTIPRIHLQGNKVPAHAAEANIIGDPEAADYVLGMASSIRLVGLDVTHRCQIPVARMTELRGRGKYGTFIEQVTRFYIQYHRYILQDAIVELPSFACGPHSISLNFPGMHTAWRQSTRMTQRRS